jgi:hypothetical protein
VAVLSGLAMAIISGTEAPCRRKLIGTESGRKRKRSAMRWSVDGDRWTDVEESPRPRQMAGRLELGSGYEKKGKARNDRVVPGCLTFVVACSSVGGSHSVDDQVTGFEEIMRDP